MNTLNGDCLCCIALLCLDVAQAERPRSPWKSWKRWAISLSVRPLPCTFWLTTSRRCLGEHEGEVRSETQKALNIFVFEHMGLSGSIQISCKDIDILRCWKHMQTALGRQTILHELLESQFCSLVWFGFSSRQKT